MDDATVLHAVEAGWLKDPVRVVVGARMRVPRGLSHRYIVMEESDRLAVMTRQMRADLKTQNPDEPPPRVMVFSDNEDQARQLSDPLRTVLWGEHSISVLLPEGSEPIKALHSFRDNQTTLLLATPAAARGLDLPAVSHVYNVAPPSDPADYLHRAGRAGRIGATSPGVITTMVTEAELPRLLEVTETLGVRLVRQEPPPVIGLTLDEEGEVDVDALKKALEDIYKLK